MKIVFWFCLLLLLWTFFAYPFALIVRERLRSRRPVPRGGSEWSPRVSVVLAVRNEAPRIVSRIRNLLEQDYPAELLEVIVICNGCTDRTQEIVDSLTLQTPRVRVLVSPAEEGKAGALNAGVAAAAGEVVVFADARQRFREDAVGRLVRALAEPGVGAVSGRLVLRGADRPAVAGVSYYWSFETRLRIAESRTGSVMGATGAIYAIRRELYQPLPPRLILDDVQVPLQIAMTGHRVLLDPEAIATDTASPDSAVEFIRKRRTMVGNLQLLSTVPKILSPSNNPIWFRFLSHKLLRVFSPLLAIGVLIPGLLIAEPFYSAVAAAQILLYLLGLAGLVWPVGVLAAPAGFLLVQAAAAAALVGFRHDAGSVWSGPVGGVSRMEAPSPFSLGRE